jgi:FAD synthase
MSNLKIKVRACLKCKECVVIHQENHKNNILLKEFEGVHRGHSLITTTKNEIPNYTRYKKKKL